MSAIINKIYDHENTEQEKFSSIKFYLNLHNFSRDTSEYKMELVFSKNKFHKRAQ